MAPQSLWNTLGRSLGSLCLGCSPRHFYGKLSHVMKTWVTQHLLGEPSCDLSNLPPAPDLSLSTLSTFVLKLCPFDKMQTHFLRTNNAVPIFCQTYWFRNSGSGKIAICVFISCTGVSDACWDLRFTLLPKVTIVLNGKILETSFFKSDIIRMPALNTLATQFPDGYSQQNINRKVNTV